MVFSRSLSLSRSYFIKTMCYISRLSFATTSLSAFTFPSLFRIIDFSFFFSFRLSPRVSFPFCNDGVSLSPLLFYVKHSTHPDFFNIYIYLQLFSNDIPAHF